MRVAGSINDEVNEARNRSRSRRKQNVIMCGTFQENMVHKTLRYSRITPSVIGDFPAVNPCLNESLEELLAVMPGLGKRRRFDITFHRNVIRRPNV